MNRKRFPPTASLILATTIALPAVRSADYHIPATISPEAQQAVARFARVAHREPLPVPDDVAGWRKVQSGIEEKYAKANAEVVKQYEPRIHELRLGDVRVLDIKPRSWTESKKVLVYTHGGAYTMYSAKSRLISSVPMANDTGLRVIAVDYALDAAGIPVKLDLYEGMWHIFQVFNHDLPESKIARKKVRAFLDQHLSE